MQNINCHTSVVYLELVWVKWSLQIYLNTQSNSEHSYVFNNTARLNAVRDYHFELRSFFSTVVYGYGNLLYS